ncbi:Hypothetical predicted protein [Paramuricea clavata]|uniref:Uncharacterized protein n=1 Tax=Paramuricea clavata TaxID=317549 RepID=A0A6S7GPL5_PARCT|nr:Hypothetical predicted protein [Paramuricea clavata]
MTKCVKEVQLHNFSDASEIGYGSASYLRTEFIDGRVTYSLVFGKSRTAPLRKISTPRVTSSAEIREKSEVQQWRYCPSKENPSDDASRRLKPSEMTFDCRWLVGPSFLKVVEVKRPAIYELLERYSSWNVLNAKIVWLTRFKFLLSRCLHRSYICPFGKPTIPELENAENDIMRMIQQQVFSEECNALSKSGKVKISSSIAKINPFIGENNIIRVGSRLEYAHISYNAKFPPILPKQHWVSELLARPAVVVPIGDFNEDSVIGRRKWKQAMFVSEIWSWYMKRRYQEDCGLLR